MNSYNIKTCGIGRLGAHCQFGSADSVDYPHCPLQDHLLTSASSYLQAIVPYILRWAYGQIDTSDSTKNKNMKLNSLKDIIYCKLFNFLAYSYELLHLKPPSIYSTDWMVSEYKLYPKHCHRPSLE